MRDLYNSSTVKELIAATRYNPDSGTEVGTAIDLKGEGRKCLLVVDVGATSTVTMQLTIQESADNSTWTTLEAATNYNTTGIAVVDLSPTKRYIRAYATFSESAETGTYIDFGAIAVVYNERYRPSNVS